MTGIATGSSERGTACVAAHGVWMFSLLIGCLASEPARAQGSGTSDVLKGSDVNEEKLLEVLAPESAAQKRSLRVRPTGSKSFAPPPASRPSASLLITFHTSSSDLTPGARQQLDVVGAALKNARLVRYKFTVEGHADPRGNPAANLVLSKDRADSVRSYLVDAQGIDPARLIAEGKGDREVLNRAFPAAPENRRVTIVTNLE